MARKKMHMNSLGELTFLKLSKLCCIYLYYNWKICVNFIFLAICRFVVDTMQSVCIKASEYDMTKSSKLEDTTLIGLTFGGYLRSKVSLPTTFVLYSFYFVLEGVVILVLMISARLNA
jgi:hypothetical protein